MRMLTTPKVLIKMNPENNPLRKIAVGFAMVTELVITVFAMTGLGYFLDGYLKSANPWATLIGSILGLVLGFYRLYRSYIGSSNE